MLHGYAPFLVDLSSAQPLTAWQVEQRLHEQGGDKSTAAQLHQLCRVNELPHVIH